LGKAIPGPEGYRARVGDIDRHDGRWTGWNDNVSTGCGQDQDSDTASSWYARDEKHGFCGSEAALSHNNKYTSTSTLHIFNTFVNPDKRSTIPAHDIYILSFYITSARYITHPSVVIGRAGTTLYLPD